MTARAILVAAALRPPAAAIWSTMQLECVAQ
jgi:hypothetical protein